jgi:hypothetical protein
MRCAVLSRFFIRILLCRVESIPYQSTSPACRVLSRVKAATAAKPEAGGAGESGEVQYNTPVRLSQTYLCVPPKLRLGMLDYVARGRQHHATHDAETNEWPLLLCAVTLIGALRKECVGKDGEATDKAILFMSTCDTVDFYYEVCRLSNALHVAASNSMDGRPCTWGHYLLTVCRIAAASPLLEQRQLGPEARYATAPKAAQRCLASGWGGIAPLIRSQARELMRACFLVLR